MKSPHDQDENGLASAPEVRPSEPERERNGWRSVAGKGLFEAALIVFSVLLALTLDGWRQDATERARLAEAVQSLAAEMVLNRDLLNRPAYLAHHRRLLEHYQSQADRGSSEGADEAFKTGLHPTPLRDTAWTTLGDSGVAHLVPFALRADLAGIYRDQQSLDVTFRSLVAALMQPRSDLETPAFRKSQIRVLATTLTDVVATENRLLRTYAQIEPQLRSMLP